MFREIPVPPDDLDSAVLAIGTAVLPPRRAAASPTIAAAPIGDRAQRVRELLEVTAACTDPAQQQQLRKSVVTEYLPVARSLAGRYSGSRRRALPTWNNSHSSAW